MGSFAVTRISTEVLAILENCRIEGQAVFIQSGQLDRKTYEGVNKVLELIGGKWSKKARCHIFEDNPAERLDSALLTGGVIDLRKQFQFFPTPAPIVERMLDVANIGSVDTVLEPSAGHGAIVDGILRRAPGVRVTAVELESSTFATLAGKGYPPSVELINADFLSVAAGRPTKVVMNPPFTRQQDVDHISRAFEWLAPGGILVAIASASAFCRDNPKSRTFQALVSRFGVEAKLPDNSFQESGTGVNVHMLTLRKVA